MPSTPQGSADRALIQEILDVEEGLSDSAIAFAESLKTWLQTNSTLTTNQRARATDILERWEEKH